MLPRSDRAWRVSLWACVLALLPACVQSQPAAGWLLLQPGALDAPTSLPALITTAPGRFVRRSDLLRACAGAARESPLRRLVLDLDGMRCSAENNRRLGVPGRFDSRAGRAADGQIEHDLAANGYALVTPARRASRPKYTCSCPGNRDPNGVVVCASQAADPSRAIAPIEFLAQDADGDSLSGFFAHRRDEGELMEGEPPGLIRRCSDAPGVLACELSGLVQPPPGQIAISWTVSDGLAELPLEASISLMPGPEGHVLFDGFEIPTCR